MAVNTGPCHWCFRRIKDRQERDVPWDAKAHMKRHFCDACAARWDRLMAVSRWGR